MIPGEPSNWCAPATDENKKYQNERLRVQIADAEATAKGKAKSSKLDAADMIRQTEKSISTDKILIARACAKKWGVAPTATDGTQPEFSEEIGRASCRERVCQYVEIPAVAGN